MTDRRPTTTSVAGATLWIVVIALAVYVGGYFVLAVRVVEYPNVAGGPDARTRVYKNRWTALAYRPAASIESSLTGYKVSAVTGVPVPVSVPFM